MLAFFLNMYTLDYLPNHIDIKLYQHKKMFRINTDTCLLGEFIKINEDCQGTEETGCVCGGGDPHVCRDSKGIACRNLRYRKLL